MAPAAAACKKDNQQEEKGSCVSAWDAEGRMAITLEDSVETSTNESRIWKQTVLHSTVSATTGHGCTTRLGHAAIGIPIPYDHRSLDEEDENAPFRYQPC